MKRSELSELYYITPIDNLASIVQRGVLSHAAAARLPHASVAMAEIQDRRARVVVPNGRRLHQYVNLYICVRNPMMFKLRNKIDEVCVLSISPAVLDLPGVVISDSNASSNYVRFAAAPNGLQIVDRSLTFADDWRDDDQIQYYRKKAAKCAEVLVPDCVAPEYLLRIYVAHEQTGPLVNAVVTELVATVDANIFFVRGD